jgi:hypothetical protein
MARLKAPEIGTVHRKCLICGRSFSVWRSRMPYRAAEFCTKGCYGLGMKVFRRLLRDGRFEAMMRQVIDEEKKAA